MGLFSIFKKKQKSMEIALTKLNKWLSFQTAEKLDNLNAALKQLFDQIEETIHSIQHSIIALQNAEITDADKIQPKIKSIVLGNRQNYIRKLNQLINAIKQPNQINHATALEFYEQVQQELNRFSKETAKSFYASQHLFHKEVEDIAKLIKTLDRYTNKIKNLVEKSNALEIDNAKNQIQNLQKQLEKKERLKNKLEQMKERFESAEQKKEQAEEKLSKLQQSEEFQKLQGLHEELKKTNQDIQAIEAQIAHIFSPLEKALRKFSKITLENEKLVHLYSEKPVQALLKDTDMKINHLLQNMKKNILSGAIELKNKKKKKTLEAIEQLTAEYLNQIIAEYHELEEKKAALEKQIKTNKQAQLKKELEYKLEHTTWIAHKLKTNMQELEKSHHKINISTLKTELEQQLKKLTKTDLKILIPSSFHPQKTNQQTIFQQP